jgi:hypothetical protein
VGVRNTELLLVNKAAADLVANLTAHHVSIEEPAYAYSDDYVLTFSLCIQDAILKLPFERIHIRRLKEKSNLYGARPVDAIC